MERIYYKKEYKKIDFYDKYILNDRPTKLIPGDGLDTFEEVYDPDLYNIFYGTTDSEYVVVGDGGGKEQEGEPGEDGPGY